MQFHKVKLIVAIAVFLLFASSPSGYCADVAKIGIVNLQKILENSEAGKAAKKELTSEGQAMEGDLQQKSEEINALQQMLERDTGVMTKEARDEKKWELERKVEDTKALKRKYDRKIQDIQLQLLGGIRQELVQIIQDFGKKDGFLLIIEDAGVLYAPQSIDVTDTIIRLYNDAYSKKGTKNQGPKK